MSDLQADAGNTVVMAELDMRMVAQADQLWLDTGPGAEPTAAGWSRRAPRTTSPRTRTAYTAPYLRTRWLNRPPQRCRGGSPKRPALGNSSVTTSLASGAGSSGTVSAKRFLPGLGVAGPRP
ncbi:hypothetical protein QJS66_15675 [Kocuria rhizophila]|nr:hypothetical protein QJS66_15675 [Kocuria rhizophila]